VRVRWMEVVYVSVSLEPVEFWVRDCVMLIFGEGAVNIGAVPVVIEVLESSQMKILPVTSQLFPTFSERVAVEPLSFNPTTFIENVC